MNKCFRGSAAASRASSHVSVASHGGGCRGPRDSRTATAEGSEGGRGREREGGREKSER